MKFKHGAVMGFIAGFLTVCAEIARRELVKDEELKSKEAELQLYGYSSGYDDAKDFLRTYHKVHHPDCDRCPH